MRITAGEKEKTRARILAGAERLFREQGFDSTSTRDLAREARIAAGTLFNYFPTKEALALTLLGDALDRARETWLEHRRAGASLDDDLFGHIAAGLRELASYRRFLAEVLETALSPFRNATDEGASNLREDVRVRHLETVAEVLEGAGHGQVTDAGTMHLYWTLYFGVLAFYAGDESPNQEDTLAFLDQALHAFVASLGRSQGLPKSPDRGPA
jgi:AcrR family transcriptional regulator